LRANPSQEGENDASQGAGHANHIRGNGAEFAQDPLSRPSGPITSRAELAQDPLSRPSGPITSRAEFGQDPLLAQLQDLELNVSRKH
jgi:hypothetical protein